MASGWLWLAAHGCGEPGQPGQTIAAAAQTISWLQTSTGSSATAVASATLTTTPLPGNLLLAIASGVNAGAVNTPASFSVAISRTDGAPSQTIFYKFAGASESKTVSVTWAASGLHALQLFEFTGVDPQRAPTSDFVTAGLGLLSRQSFGEVTTTASGALVIAAGASEGITLGLLRLSYTDWANGFTELNDFTIGGLLDGFSSAYVIAGSAGTYSTSAASTLLLTASLGQTVTFTRKPAPATDLAVSAGASANTVMLVPPDELISQVLILARTGDCTFSVEPTGSEARGAAVGSSAVIFNDAPDVSLAATSVPVGGATTTVSYDPISAALTHQGLTAGTLYCYKVYVRNGATLDDAGGSGRPTRSGIPLPQAPGYPLFVFNAGSTSLSAPSVLPGVGAFYADNAGKVMSVTRAGLRRFVPYTLPNAVQNRGPVGTLGAEADATAYVSSLSGDAYALWGSGPSAGTLRWSTVAVDGNNFSGGDQALGSALYAPPLVSNTLGRVFVATRNGTGAQNRVYAFDAANGGCIWVYNGSCSGATGLSNLGQVSAVPVLDPSTSRLIVTSSQLAANTATLWALDARDAASPRLLWSRNDLGGGSDSAATFSNVERTSFYVGTNAGRIYHLDTRTGATCWGASSDGCGTSSTSGAEQFFCTASQVRATSCSGGAAIQKGLLKLNAPYVESFLFSTIDGSVRRVSRAGVQLWKQTIAGASSPVAVSELGVAYVGGNDGLVHELSLASGTQTGTRSAGGGAVIVGDPAYDATDGVLYVNNSQGSLYAFSVPF